MSEAPAGSSRYGAWREKLGGFETHAAALAWIPRGARVLDVGCAGGYLARLLGAERGCRVAGIEMDPAAAAEARGPCDRVHVGSLEDPAFLEAVDETADVVFFGDVLEHLADARPVLRRARSWLAPGGAIICSIPNVAYWKIRLELLRGGSSTRRWASSTGRISASSRGRAPGGCWRRPATASSR